MTLPKNDLFYLAALVLYSFNVSLIPVRQVVKSTILDHLFFNHLLPFPLSSFLRLTWLKPTTSCLHNEHLSTLLCAPVLSVSRLFFFFSFDSICFLHLFKRQKRILAYAQFYILRFLALVWYFTGVLVKNQKIKNSKIV